MGTNQQRREKVKKINSLVQSFCGLYSRVARRLRLNPSYVSRVARGERSSEVVEKALEHELARVGDEIIEANQAGSTAP
jgi:hypothetical protein